MLERASDAPNVCRSATVCRAVTLLGDGLCPSRSQQCDISCSLSIITNVGEGGCSWQLKVVSMHLLRQPASCTLHHNGGNTSGCAIAPAPSFSPRARRQRRSTSPD
uniref:Uncharacterized protein n=1 Tax=Noctiluca scintillans TaxID=2966 RepID=A0A7S1A951_NOCSC